jgi:hypothetical protein
MLSRDRAVHHRHAAFRDCRSVGPCDVEPIGSVHESDTLRNESRFQHPACRNGHAGSVDSHLGFGSKGIHQILHVIRDSRAIQLHQRERRSFDLLGSLDVVSGIDPQQGALARHDDGSRRSGKAGQPGTGPPPGSNILTSVGIASIHYPGIDARRTHEAPDLLQLPCNIIHDAVLRFFWLVLRSSFSSAWNR